VGVFLVAWPVFANAGPTTAVALALQRLQRMAVSFVFEGVEEEARQRFMKHFDLTMQRGGG
jgi:hypothetical protein